MVFHCLLGSWENSCFYKICCLSSCVWMGVWRLVPFDWHQTWFMSKYSELLMTFLVFIFCTFSLENVGLIFCIFCTVLCHASICQFRKPRNYFAPIQNKYCRLIYSWKVNVRNVILIKIWAVVLWDFFKWHASGFSMALTL